jgi:tetratricopeptide (TPR) repeat protein
MCLQMVGGLTLSPRVKALRGYCYFRGGQEVEALKSVDDAAAQGVKDALVQSLYAFILDGIGQETRASVALGKATELNASIRLALPMILQGRFYARAGKHKMALELWQSLYRADEKSLVGLAGLAEAHFSLKNYSEAQGYLVEGFRLSKDYRPLYRVKKRAEREGLMPKGSF